MALAMRPDRNSPTMRLKFDWNGDMAGRGAAGGKARDAIARALRGAGPSDAMRWWWMERVKGIEPSS